MLPTSSIRTRSPARSRLRLAALPITVLAVALAAQAAPPLSNCTARVGTLSNGNSTCTFTVTTSDDVVSGDASGYVPLAGSLRRAIVDANAWGNYGNVVSGDAVITFAPGLAGQTIALSHALPILMANITINGPADGTAIDGGASDFATGVRCFFVSGLPVAGSGPAANPDDGMPQAVHVRLSRLTIRNCRANGGAGSGGGLGAGGALFVNQQATVDLDRVNFTGNRAIGGTGFGGARGGGGMGGGTVGFSGGGGIGGSAGNSYGAGGGIGGGSFTGTGGGGFGLDVSEVGNASRGIGLLSDLQGFATAEAGGANGGGGGAGGFPGHGYGGGGSTPAGGGIAGAYRGGVGGGGAFSATTGPAGSGGFGGGGGGTATSASNFLAGGNGGFGGGGGAGTYCGCSTPGIAGIGGFGGGGGFGLNGGAGGFGAGAGSAGSSASPAARSGFGAANPTAASLTPANGTAMGGALFAVNRAVINFLGNGELRGSRLSNAVPREISPVGNDGLLLGEGIFLQGNGTLTMTQGVGETLTLNDDIMDQTGSANRLADPTPTTFASGGPFNGTDWSYSSRGSWSIIKNGPGTLVLGGGFNNFSGQNRINGGTLLLQNTALGAGSWTNHARLVWGTMPFGAPPLNVGLGNGTLSNSLFTQSSTGITRMRLSGPACDRDWLSVAGETAFGGTFWIDVAGGCVPANGSSEWYIASNANSGQFDRIVVTGMPAGRTLVPIYEAQLFRLQEAAGASASVLNIDASDAATRYQVATDGLLIMRYLLGLRGSALTANALGSTPGRNAAQIESYLASIINLLDVDGDGQTLATTDGVMIIRRLLGLSGAALTAGAKVGPASDSAVEFANDALRP